MTEVVAQHIFSLQSILQHHVNADWLQHSYPSWVERCQNTNSAESVELLKEVLVNSDYQFICPESRKMYCVHAAYSLLQLAYFCPLKMITVKKNKIE